MKISFIAVFIVGFVVGTAACSTSQSALRVVTTTVDDSSIAADSWGEVVCGRGALCADVQVVRVDVLSDPPGSVSVTLHNRSSAPIAAQVELEVIDDQGIVIDATNWQDVPLEARQAHRFVVPAIAQPGHRIRVSLRDRSS
jgi:hypothetical protein